MADELTISGLLRFLKGDEDADFQVSGLKVDVTGTKVLINHQTVGYAAEEALELGDVGVGGYFACINLDDTNFVEIRPATGVADLVKVGPGEFACFRLVATAPFVQADTGDCELKYMLIEA